jgi:hypothetical protein
VRPLGGKWRQLVGKVREWYVASRHLQGCIPRLRRLRTDGLAPWACIERIDGMLVFMDPVSLVVYYQQRVALPPLLQWLAWERNWERTHGSVSRRAMDSVGSSGSVHRCWWWYEGLLYVDHVIYVWSWTIHGLSVGSVWHVGWIFPYRVYIDSNHRDSQIWVTTCLW